MTARFEMATFHMMPIKRYPIVDSNIFESNVTIFFLVWCKLWAPDENQRVHSVKTPDFSDQQLNVDNRLLIIVYVRSFPVMTGQNRIIQILKCFKSQVILEAQNVILSFNSIKPDLLTDAARAIFFVFYNQYYY